MDWHYADASRNQHQCQDHELAGLVAAGAISPITLVWNETMTQWRPASEALPDLFPSHSVPPVLTPDQRRAVAFSATDATSLPGQRAPLDPVAITSLCLAIGAVLFCLGPILGIPAIVCGHIGRRRAKAETLPSSNGGLSLAGLIVGYVVTVVSVVVAVFYIFLIVDLGNSLNELNNEIDSIEAAPAEAEVMTTPEFVPAPEP
ncbi:MAG TPA: DUF4190 domain-containing protein [Bacteroidia bacterium]|nr:DUF4190 domain-containing protein [Bacteroidia bacterium]